MEARQAEQKEDKAVFPVVPDQIASQKTTGSGQEKSLCQTVLIAPNDIRRLGPAGDKKGTCDDRSVKPGRQNQSAGLG